MHYSLCGLPLTNEPTDDSAAHIAEETAGAAGAAPLAILISVFATASLGWLLFIAASFATASVTDILSTDLPLPMGQLFLTVLGKHGMLAIWSFIIVVQVGIAQIIEMPSTTADTARSMSLGLRRWSTLPEWCLLSHAITHCRVHDGGSG